MSNQADNFKAASRLKLRFETPRGLISIEDVWDLPFTSKTGVSLDDVAKTINQKLNQAKEESFVAKKTTVADELELKFELIKTVIEARLEEAEQKKNKASKDSQRSIIKGILEEKQLEGLKEMSEAELIKMLEG